jgi:hypothetical protein
MDATLRFSLKGPMIPRFLYNIARR